MKIIYLIFTLCCFLFTNSLVFAANNSLMGSYPAPSGSYNKLVLQNLPANASSCTSSNAGMLFFNTTTNSMQLCATVNGTPVIIPSGETCFNRFCSGVSCSFNGCPSGFIQAKKNSGTTALVDTFVTNGISVSSTICCSSTIIVPTT